MVVVSGWAPLTTGRMPSRDARNPARASRRAVFTSSIRVPLDPGITETVSPLMENRASTGSASNCARRFATSVPSASMALLVSSSFACQAMYRTMSAAARTKAPM